MLQLNGTMHCVQGTVPFGITAKAAYEKPVPRAKGALKKISSNNLFVCLVFKQGLQLVLGAALLVLILYFIQPCC